MTLPLSTRSSVKENASQAVTLLNQAVPFDDVYAVAVPAMQMAARKVTLTSAQILALNSTPISLVPAPGAGRTVIVHGITARLTYNSAAYATNTTLEFRYTDGSGAKVTADLSALLTATANKNQFVAGVVTALTPVTNAAIVVCVPSGNPATGNSPVEITVHYSEVESL